MLLASVLFLAGLLMLYFGADFLVNGSSRLALSYGIRPLIIGMTVVAFATSMPEMLVSLVAAMRGSADLAVGNIVGSNVANIGLILGAAALLCPMPVAPSVLRRELPFMIGSSLLLYAFCFDGMISAGNGLVLLVLLCCFLGYCLRSARSGQVERVDTDRVREEQARRGRDLLLIVAGIIGLGIGAEMMVRSAMTIARHFGISELVIGISVVALGTSLPELAASMMSAWKGEMELSIGNVIGSNIFNILFVLGLCPLFSPLAVQPALLWVELPLMIAFSVGLLLICLGRRLNRMHGLLLLVCYVLFIGMVFWR